MKKYTKYYPMLISIVFATECSSLSADEVEAQEGCNVLSAAVLELNEKMMDELCSVSSVRGYHDFSNKFMPIISGLLEKFNTIASTAGDEFLIECINPYASLEGISAHLMGSKNMMDSENIILNMNVDFAKRFLRSEIEKLRVEQ